MKSEEKLTGAEMSVTASPGASLVALKAEWLGIKTFLVF